jgi:hypothetical protein
MESASANAGMIFTPFFCASDEAAADVGRC